MEKLTLINGNKQKYELSLPTLLIKGHINDVALQHIFENTELDFKKTHWSNYEAKPENSQQIVKFLMTYNFEYTFYNNYDIKNTIIFEYKSSLDVNKLKEEYREKRDSFLKFNDEQNQLKGRDCQTILIFIDNYLVNRR